jgi:hypothetical protein
MMEGGATDTGELGSEGRACCANEIGKSGATFAPTHQRTEKAKEKQP